MRDRRMACRAVRGFLIPFSQSLAVAAAVVIVDDVRVAFRTSGGRVRPA